MFFAPPFGSGQCAEAVPMTGMAPMLSRSSFFFMHGDERW